MDHGPELVEVPTGSYLRGSPANARERVHDVFQRPVHIAYRLAVGRYAVTFAEWDQCVAEGACPHRPDDEWGRDRQPVIKVSWLDIHDHFLRWANRKVGLAELPAKHQLRLLTEAEWEYACRAGGAGPFNLGPDNDSRLSPARANYDGGIGYQGSPTGECRLTTLPVESFEPNAWGLHQMHGNVWEWLQDSYEADYRQVSTDGSAHGSLDDREAVRVLRGGGWFNGLRRLRSAFRDRASPDYRHNFIGFRLARMLA